MYAIARFGLVSLGALAAGLTPCGGVSAQNAAPGFEVRVDRGPETVPIGIASDLRPGPAFEAAPVVVDGSDLMFVSTGWSWLCRDEGGLFSTKVQIDSQHCTRFSLPVRLDSSGKQVPPDQANASHDDWRRSYYGVLSALKIPAPWRNFSYVAVMHGENKNEKIGQNYYANSVNTAVKPDACASGYTNGRYDDCWTAYNAFVGMMFFNGGAGAKLDIGPVLWPSAGYVQGETKVSSGLRHPTAIALDGFVYIYYLDTSRGKEPGRQGGLVVARMPMPKGDGPLPAAQTWFNSQFSNDNPSLPRGFSKDRIAEFYGRPGGQAQELWPQSWQTLLFNVARIAGTSKLVGVEEYGARNSWGVRLRTSTDGVHWSAPIDVPGVHSNEGWAKGNLHYPTFVNERGASAHEIDPNGFYIVGSGAGGKITRYHVSLKMQP